MANVKIALKVFRRIPFHIVLLMKSANNIFSISLSYVRPGKRFDLTCNQFGWAKKGKREYVSLSCKWM